MSKQDSASAATDVQEPVTGAAPGGDGERERQNPWAANEEKLSRQLRDTRAAATDLYHEWRRSVDGLFSDWRQLLKEFGARHAVHLESVESARPESEGRLTREVLDGYRTIVAAEILEPLLDVSTQNRPPVDVLQRFRRMLDGAARLALRFPESLRMLDPDELYRPLVGDTLGERARKLGHSLRLRSSAASFGLRTALGRLARRPAPRRIPRSRITPARHLAVYYLSHQWPQLLIHEQEDARRELTAVVGALEQLIGVWANSVLVVSRETVSDDETAGQGIPWDLVPEPSPPPGETTGETGGDTDEASSATHKEGGVQPTETTDSEPSPFDALVDAATAFQSGLDELAESVHAPPSSSSDRLGSLFDEFGSDLERAGTFLLPPSRRPATGPPAALDGLTREEETWSAWYGQVDRRIRYYLDLMRLRDRLIAAERSIVRRVGRATVIPVLNTFADMSLRLSKAGQKIASLAEDAESSGDLTVLAEGLHGTRVQLTGFVQQIFRHLPGLVSSDQVLSDPGRSEWDDVSGFVNSLPELVEMHDPKVEASTAAGSKTVEIRLRHLISDVLDPPLPERLKRPAEQLRSAVRRVWTETEQIQHIVQYNLDAAVEEMEPRAPAEQEADTSAVTQEPRTDSDTIETAQKLVVDGLSRASMTLGQLAATLRPAWLGFVEAVNLQFRQDWTDVHRRLHTADTAEEQWAGLRSRVGREVSTAVDRAGEFLRRIGSAVARMATLGRRRAESLIRMGQSAVGVLETEQITRFETIEALAGVEGLRENLPLIYRRLFSFEPLDETSLLEGRSRDLVWVKQHFSRWEEAHQLGVLVVQAELGSGRTSFLNALRDTVFAERDVCSLNLRERIYDADHFARLLAAELGYTDGDLTIDELEERILQSQRTDPPQVCLIDNLEHLVLRTSSGGDTIERVVLFLSRTDRSIYWIGTIGTHTWQFLTKTAGTAVGFVDAYPLTSLDRATLESVIVNRHRRSGMALHFVEPDDASALLRQRLKRAKMPEQRQELAREEFFDRLWKAAGQNVMLALFYWIRSAEFSDDDSMLTVRPLRPLRFDYLNELPLDHAFALKAFLLHKTLSLSDHRLIFHTEEAESTAILESLLNSYVIEQVPHAERHAGEDYHVQRDAVYKMRPLLIHPVASSLRSKNIIY